MSTAIAANAFSRNLRPDEARRSRGFTLMEMVIGLALIAIIALVFGEIVMSSTNSMDYLVKDNTADQEIKRALNMVLSELRLSTATSLTITSASDQDSINFQTPNSYGGSVNWGAADQTGAWSSGWSVQYLVDANDNLVRQVLDGLGNAVGTDEVLVRNANPAGLVKGFQVTQNGSVVNVVIRVLKTMRDGNTNEKEMSSSVFLKNN